MHQHSRLASVLSHLTEVESPVSSSIDLDRLERNLACIFQRDATEHGMHLIMNVCSAEEDTGEPSDRFVKLSRNLQSDTNMKGYNNFKKGSRSHTPASRAPKSEPTALDALFDPKILMGVAATGLAFAFLPSSSPVSRSLLVGRLGSKLGGCN